MEAVQDASGRRPGTDRRGWLIGLVAVATLVGTWLATAPNAIGTPGGIVGVQLAPGDAAYIGTYSLATEDVIVESIEPVTLNGLETALWLCVPIPGTDVIGASDRAGLDAHCDSVDPFVAGTVLAAPTPGADTHPPYLLVEVIATSDQPQGMCGLDITYRTVDGWRTGRAQQAGEVLVGVNEPDDPDDPDEPVESDERLLTACAAW